MAGRGPLGARADALGAALGAAGPPGEWDLAVGGAAVCALFLAARALLSARVFRPASLRLRALQRSNTMGMERSLSKRLVDGSRGARAEPEALGRRASRKASKRGAKAARGKTPLEERFVGSCYGCFAYGLTFAVGLALMAGELSRENWAAGLYEPEFWAHYLPRSCRSARALSLPCEGLEFSLWLRLWYIFVFGFFCSEVFVLAQEKLEGRAKSDFPAMVIHHAVTLVLIFTSWRYRLLRIGSVVAILHLNDVFMEVAKLSRYTNHYNLALASFVMFALSWLVLRLVLFPPLVLLTAAGARASILGVLGRVAGPEYVRALTSLTYSLTGCLITVLGLDLYWGALIVGVMKKALTESVSNAGDSRED